jgi:ankyrin repeat protein
MTGAGYQRLRGIIAINFTPNSNYPEDHSQIYAAAESGDLETVESLLDAGATVSPQALYVAANQGTPSVVKALAVVVENTDAGGGFCGNALCAAASDSSRTAPEVISILLQNGADVNWQGGHYGNALQTATAHYRLQNFLVLVEHGADVNAQSGHYGNALTAAARHATNFKEIAKVLLQLGADIDAEGPGVYGNPLQTAVYIGHVKNVKFLLEHGADKWISGQFGSAMNIAERGAFRFPNDQYRAEKIRQILGIVPECVLSSE